MGLSGSFLLGWFRLLLIPTHLFRHSALPLIKFTTKWFLLAIITWKEAASMIFYPYCLPRLLPPSRKIKHTKTHAHSRTEKSNNNFYVWFLTQKPCSTCSTHLRGCLACFSSFSAFTLIRLLGFPLFRLILSVVADHCGTFFSTVTIKGSPRYAKTCFQLERIIDARIFEGWAWWRTSWWVCSPLNTTPVNFSLIIHRSIKEHSLAEGFDIKDGSISIKCPLVNNILLSLSPHGISLLNGFPILTLLIQVFCDSRNRSPSFNTPGGTIKIASPLVLDLIPERRSGKVLSTRSLRL